MVLSVTVCWGKGAVVMQWEGRQAGGALWWGSLVVNCVYKWVGWGGL